MLKGPVRSHVPVLVSAFLALTLMLTACQSGPSVPDPDPPVAHAGPDQTVTTGETVTLDGSASSALDASALSFAWSFVSHPDGSSASIDDSASPIASFTADVAGVYVIELRVSDGDRAATDTVTITATAAVEGEATLLEPGGSVFHPSGAVVAAQLDTMASGVDVTIVEVADPSEEVALPAGVTIVGQAFRFSASPSVAADVDFPFLIGLLVPEGVDVGGLAIGVRETDNVYVSFVPPEGEDAGVLEASWVVLEGLYHPESNRLFTPVLALQESGWDAVIVRAEGYETMVIDDEVTGEAVRADTAPTFEGRCGPGFADAPETCTAADRLAISEMLEEAYLDLTALGFTTKPRLMRGTSRIVVHYTPPIMLTFTWVPAPYLIELRPSSAANAGGMFSIGTGRIWIAMGTTGVTEGRRRVVRHEYVHATQYGYDPIHRSGEWLRSRWTEEGQAVLLESGYDPLARANRAVRAVDISLEHSKWDGSNWLDGPAVEYQSQDLWLYLANRFGHEDASFLEPFMAEGMRAVEVDRVLRSNYPAAFGGSGADSGLARAYWEWVKNQTFTKEVDMGSVRFGTTCSFTAGSATHTSLSFAPGERPEDQELSLEPLTSHVYLVHMAAEPRRGYLANVNVVSSSDFVRSAIYEAVTAGGTDCFTQADRSALSAAVDSEPRWYWVIVSNTSSTDDLSHTLTFSEPQSVSITSPAAGSSFDEGASIPFRAVVNGFDDPNIRWTWRRAVDQAFFTFGTTINLETLSYSALCDGDYVVSAEVAEGLSTSTVSASVAFSVSDLGASTPPVNCAPTVRILDPLDGATYPSGDPLTLSAEVEHNTPPFTTPRYPIVWSSGGDELGTGSPLTIENGLSAGSVTIRVDYGAASDEVTLLVVDTANTPPSATILSPADGSEYVWDDVTAGGASNTVTFTGTGWSPEEGFLTGASLTWEVRQTVPTVTSWFQQASGSPADLTFSWNSCFQQTFEVRLRATDSQGLVGSDTIEIRVTPPTC